MKHANFRATPLCGLLLAFIALLNCAIPHVHSSDLLDHSSRPPAEGAADQRQKSPNDQPAQKDIQDAFGKLPLSFEANYGQADPRVKFLSRADGYRLLLTPNEACLSAMTPQSASAKKTAQPTDLWPARVRELPGVSEPGPSLRMRLVNGNASAKAAGAEPLPGKSHYLLGNDPRKWRTNIPNYAKVKFEQVYPGIDLIYYGNQRQLEYDFVISPGTDPAAVVLAFEGVVNVSIDQQGGLRLATSAGSIRQSSPAAYQMEGNIRRPIAAGYLLKGKNQVSFQVSAYDHSKPLVIDPVLAYSTFFGGNSFDRGNAIAVDAAGNAYVTGSTRSSDFPVTPGAFQGALASPFNDDAFVLKLNATGTALIYSTYFGGGGRDIGNAIAVDAAGNAYVTGLTDSSNLPTTPGAFRATPVGSDESDAFAMKLNPTGSALVYSTYLGPVIGSGIAADSAGNAYIAGQANGDYPTTPGAFQPAYGGNSDAFVTKLNATGTALVYSTFLGGSGFDFATAIAIDAAGNATVVGGAGASFPVTAGAFQTAFNGVEDAFVARLNAAGSALAYATYLGGSGDDIANDVALDAAGNAYVAGFSNSANYPVTAGAFQPANAGNIDAVVTKLNAAGSALVYSTYIGGSGDDVAFGIAVDGLGSAVITGRTISADFPITAGAIQPALAGNSDAFVTRLNVAGTGLNFSTFLGGVNADAGLGITLDSAGNIYVAGETFSSDFPTTPGAFQTAFGGGPSDGFVVKITSITFDVCLRDDGDGNLFQFNSTTGEYRFTACGSGGTTIDGSGTLSRRGCLLVLEDQQAGRRIKAQVNECVKKGQAVIQVRADKPTTFVITDKDTTDSNCACL